MSDEDELQLDDERPEGQEPKPLDVGDPQQVRKRATQIAVAQEDVDNLWCELLATRVGRRLVWRLVNDDLHAFESRFATAGPGFPQQDATWFQAGQTAVGQDIYLRLAKLDRPNILLMHDENDPKFADPTGKQRKK